MTKTEQRILAVLARGDNFAITSQVQARIAARMVDEKKIGILQRTPRYAFQTFYAVTIPNCHIVSGEWRYVALSRFKTEWEI